MSARPPDLPRHPSGRGHARGGVVRYLLLTLLLLFPAALAAQDPRQAVLLKGRVGVDPAPGSLLATPARLTASGLPLSEALARLAERSRVLIAFSPTLLPRDHHVDCDCTALNTARALDRILAGTGLGYVELGPQVVVVPLAPPDPLPPGGTIRSRVRTEVAVLLQGRDVRRTSQVRGRLRRAPAGTRVNDCGTLVRSACRGLDSAG